MKLLGGREERSEEEERGEKGGKGKGKDREEEEEITREEIDKAIERAKEGKAPGGDGITNDVWRYGGEGAREWVWRVCNRVWRGEGWPEDWKVGVIAPIVKKGVGEKVEE